MRTGVKASSAVTRRNQEQVLWARALMKGQRRKDMAYRIQLNVKKNKLFEAKKKASLESLPPFWPPSKT